MSAYMVVFARVDDAEQFGKYVEAVQPLIAAHGGKLIGRGVPPVVLEGNWPWHTVGVLEFPSVEAAETFWHSPEYTEVKKLREGNSEFQVVVASANS
ncbi:MAG: DUF1330 domain-containing protein [Novosphingobium sp.]|jgi:uncharacterized protein (DUF1330 family)|uniref:DUF1330 domain-containing protein n=1 Tax=Tsuneonella sp. CC-YZS046 TaxID=3042152 RepID=UPI002D776BAC|nr:DUF1330 domain-containing protein [Tsuneonella sp. CC-YZS046]WRO66489.1 DUF1330 domain-containing protein [Tsuneonella sp. CC-YZS046]